MSFKIGQIFNGEYPPEAAVWCNELGDCYINEIEAIDGKRRFQIVKAPEPTTEELAAQARSQRDALIAATDYLMATDYPLTNEKRQELTVYRQALRDVPEQPGFPTEIVWPTKPEWVK